MLAPALLLTLVGGYAEAALVRVIVTGGTQEFTPQQATIKVGDKVVWINQDHEIHSLVSSGLPSRQTASGPEHLLINEVIPPGSSYTHIFAEAGTYDYFCAIHMQVWGVVIAEE